MYNTDCSCVGPQAGEPYCFCVMQEHGVYQKDGKWIDPWDNNKIIGEVEEPADD